jgi:Uncharacterised nucleotidyltransferase
MGRTNGNVHSTGLGGVLSLLLPTPEQTLFLRACLQPGDAARSAWDAWRERPGARRPLASDLHEFGVLLPLLSRSLRAGGVELPRDLAASLGAACLAEELRERSYRQVCREALFALTATRVPFLVLKGAALAHTVYPQPPLRHCHDLDLLAAPDDLRLAATALREAGFSPAGDGRRPGDSIRLVHATGMPVELHGQLFRLPHYGQPADLSSTVVPREVAGVPVRVLAPAEALVHVCGQASCSASRDSLRWVSDAWYLLAASPELCWDSVVATVRRWRLALPVSAMLGYLAGELGAAIPASVLAEVEGAAARASGRDREAALSGVRAGNRGTLGGLLRSTRRYGPRITLFKWMLCPSPSYLRSSYGGTASWLLPLYYLHRPLRAAFGSRRRRRAHRAESGATR